MEIVIPLAKDYERPTIEANGIKALVDTGSMIPVLSLSGDYLEKNLLPKRLWSRHLSLISMVGTEETFTDCRNSMWEG